MDSQPIESEHIDEAEDPDRQGLDESTEPTPELFARRVAFAGRLGSLSRRTAAGLVRQFGGTVVTRLSDAVDIVVVGADESPLSEAELLGPQICEAARRGEVEILPETDFLRRLGVDRGGSSSRLYTPAMLADLLGVSVRVIRRWHRRGLIVPARTVHRLPYFEFQEVATARRLAELLASGAAPEAIERKLAQLSDVLPDVARPLAQLSVIVEGKQILLRQGEGLIEPGGQMRIDFDRLDEQYQPEMDPGAEILAMPGRDALAFPVPGESDEDELLSRAYALEDQGDLQAAVDTYHAILARDGARADICFQLGELLYRMGQVDAARERYYAAIELDDEFVEARASLGSVLAETGRPELAVAAFRGALSLHDDYPDVHYNLARTLDDLGRTEEAEPHWQRFLELADGSPWASEALLRLGVEEAEEDF